MLPRVRAKGSYPQRMGVTGLPIHCPKCGFHDPPCWRHMRWTLDQDYCHIEELETFDPELAAEIIAVHPTHKLPMRRGIFVYMLTPTRYVRRQWAEDFLTYGFNHRQTESGRNEERLRMREAQTHMKDFLGDPTDA